MPIDDDLTKGAFEPVETGNSLVYDDLIQFGRMTINWRASRSLAQTDPQCQCYSSTQTGGGVATVDGPAHASLYWANFLDTKTQFAVTSISAQIYTNDAADRPLRPVDAGEALVAVFRYRINSTPVLKYARVYIPSTNLTGTAMKAAIDADPNILKLIRPEPDVDDTSVRLLTVAPAKMSAR